MSIPSYLVDYLERKAKRNEPPPELPRKLKPLPEPPKKKKKKPKPAPPPEPPKPLDEIREQLDLDRLAEEPDDEWEAELDEPDDDESENIMSGMPSDAGQPIEGSRYVRGYCVVCKDPVRVSPGNSLNTTCDHCRVEYKPAAKPINRKAMSEQIATLPLTLYEPTPPNVLSE